MSWVVLCYSGCRIVYEILECLKRCMINEVACYLYAYHAPWLATGSAKGTAVNEIFHQDNISSHEMYALETYKLAQDADKVWNGKKMKSSTSYHKFQIQANIGWNWCLGCFRPQEWGRRCKHYLKAGICFCYYQCHRGRVKGIEVCVAAEILIEKEVSVIFSVESSLYLTLNKSLNTPTL